VKQNGGAPGVDGVTVDELQAHLWQRWETVKTELLSGTYKPMPVRRVEIPKPGGGIRLLGIPALEDKIVQMGITRILNAIYEPNFLDCSYGYRKGRDCHAALKQLDNTIMAKPVNHVIDADICAFFDNVNHEWMMKMLQERIADKNLLKLIRRFLKAGIMEDGKIIVTDEAVPQGGIDFPSVKQRLPALCTGFMGRKGCQKGSKGVCRTDSLLR